MDQRVDPAGGLIHGGYIDRGISPNLPVFAVCYRDQEALPLDAKIRQAVSPVVVDVNLTRRVWRAQSHQSAIDLTAAVIAGWKDKLTAANPPNGTVDDSIRAAVVQNSARVL